MRKTIFFALLLAATAAQAQKLNLQRISSSWTMPLLIQEQPVFAEEQATEMSELSEEAVLANAGPRNSAANFVFYQRPEGAFYQGQRPADWSNFPVTKVVVQPWQEYTYKNLCANRSAASWDIEGTAVSGDGENNYSEMTEPIPEGYIDHYMPTISVDGVSYSLGEDNVNYSTYTHAGVAWADSIVEMAVYDPGRVIGQSGTTVFTNFRPLSMSQGYKYNYGTMAFQNGGNTYYCRGIRQFFEKPMGRLWVENITIPAISYSAEPVMYGQWITMTINKVSIVDGKKTVGETIATLLCHWNDIINLGSQSVSDGTVQMLSLVFKPEEEIILDEEFAIVIEGFQDDGVDLGLAAALIDPCDAGLVEPASMLLQNANHEDINATLTFQSRVPCISIRGIYDGIKMVSTGSALSLTAPTTGGDCTLEGQTTQAKVQLKTAIRWNYGKVDQNYDIEGLPEWLHVTVDESKREINGNKFGNGLVTLTLKADAVPENTPDREATLTIKGHGVESAESITVFQKGYEVDGIEEVTSSDGNGQRVVARYSLDGRQLPANAKGVQIIVTEKGTRKVVY